MKNLFLAASMMLFAPEISAFDFQGYVETENGSHLYVEHVEAAEGMPTYAFVNGLVFRTERWNVLTDTLVKKGYGLVRYEFEGQNRSYVYSMDDHDGKPDWLENGITLAGAAEQLKDILDDLEIEQVKLLTLSYGSSIGTTFLQNYPERVTDLTLVSPLIISTDYYDPNGKMFRYWLNSIGIWGPVGQYWADFYYDLYYKAYFKSLNSTRSDDFGEWERDYYRAVFQQVKSARDFDLRKIDLSGVSDDFKVNLILASEENPKYLPDQISMWDVFPEEHKGSLVLIEGGAHSVVESHPHFVNTVLEKFENDPWFSMGGAFRGVEHRGEELLIPTAHTRL